MNIWKFGDNVNTDVIIPGRYLNTTDPKELAEHLMEDADNKEFIKYYLDEKKSIKGDIFTGGDNFGCGSSREHAPLAIYGAGVDIIIAKSFARIFYRNCINVGINAIESEAAEDIKQGDNIEVILNKGKIIVNNEREYNFNPVSGLMKEITDAGGIMNYWAKKLGHELKDPKE